MALNRIQHVTIIGVGLLGGSAGLAIKAADPRVRIAGVGRRAKSLRQAMKVGAIDSAHMDASQAVADSDLVILATPIGAFEAHLLSIRDHLKRGAIVTDVGSTKLQVVRTAQRVLRNSPCQFVGSHPMAGSELKGPSHARADLFAGATCIITPTPSTPATAVRRVERFWRTLGMATVRLSPTDHDAAVARISHLPHALSTMLMMLPSQDDLKLAATGFRDATRLAGGDPQMWRDIFLDNRTEVLRAIAKLDKSFKAFRKTLESGNAPALEKLLTAAQTRRENTILKSLYSRRPAAE